MLALGGGVIVLIFVSFVVITSEGAKRFGLLLALSVTLVVKSQALLVICEQLNRVVVTFKNKIATLGDLFSFLIFAAHRRAFFPLPYSTHSDFCFPSAFPVQSNEKFCIDCGAVSCVLRSPEALGPVTVAMSK